jgi:hypothetical protein
MFARPPFLVPIILAALLAGCGDGGLEAVGFARVTGPELDTRFELTSLTRLDDVDASAEGRLTGSCEIVRERIDGAAQYGAVVDLRRTSDAEDQGLRRLTVMARSDDASTGIVEATLGATLFQSTADCEVQVDWQNAGSGFMDISAQCDVEAEGRDALALDVELDFSGCTVIDG